MVHKISGVEMRAYKNLADEGMAFGNKVRFHNHGNPNAKNVTTGPENEGSHPIGKLEVGGWGAKLGKSWTKKLIPDTRTPRLPLLSFPTTYSLQTPT